MNNVNIPDLQEILRLNSYKNYIVDSTIVISREDALNEPSFKIFEEYTQYFERILLVKDLIVRKLSGFPTILEINNLRDSCDGIIFLNCTIEGDITFNPNSNKISSIFILDCNIGGKISFNCKVEGNIILHNTDVIKGVEIRQNTEIANTLIFNNCRIEEGDIKFIDIIIVKNIHILDNSDVRGSIIIYTYNSENVLINQVSVGNQLLLLGTINTMYIETLKSETLSIEASCNVVDISNIEIESWENIEIKFQTIKELKFRGNIVSKNGISFYGNYDYLDFKDVYFTGNQIKFCDDTTINQLKIINSKILPNLGIEKAKVHTIEIADSILRNLQIQKSNINIFQVDDTTFEYNLSLSDTTITTSFSVEDTKVFDNFFIMGCHSLNKTENEVCNFRINHLLVKSNFLLRDSSFQSIFFNHLITLQYCTLSEIIVYDECSFENSLHCLSFRIDENSKLKNLTLSDWKSKEINIEKVTIESNKVIFLNCFIETFRPFEYSKFEYFFLKCQFNDVQLVERTNPKDTIFTFIDCQIGQLNISHFNNLGNLFMRDIQVLPIVVNNPDRLKLIEDIGSKDFDEIFESGTEYINLDRFFDLENKLVLNQSSLGKAEFTNCNFDDFHFYYNNTKLTETFISGGKMPQSIDIEGIDEVGNPIEYYSQKVVVYNQIKKIFENQGDIFQSSFFQSKASETQAKLLRSKITQKVWSIKTEEKNLFKQKKLILKEKFFSQNAWERLSFLLNEVSNNHGESWGRALVFTITFGLITFFLFLFSNKYLLNFWIMLHPFKSQMDIDWSFISNNFHYFFDFLNPTHKTDLIKGSNPSAWSGFWDILGRILIGYGIFQFIAAFRKHSKK